MLCCLLGVSFHFSVRFESVRSGLVRVTDGERGGGEWGGVQGGSPGKLREPDCHCPCTGFVMITLSFVLVFGSFLSFLNLYTI